MKHSSFLQVVEEGFEFFADNHLVTIFSAPDYCEQFTNAGGILSVGGDLNCTLKVSQRFLIIELSHHDPDFSRFHRN